MAARARSSGLLGEAPPGVSNTTPIPLQSLSAAEAGQVAKETQSANQAHPAESKNAKSKYIGLLRVSELQARDPNYQGVRAFSNVFAFTQAYLEHRLNQNWDRIQSAINSGDDASVERLMEEEVISKVFSTLKLAHLRHFMGDLNQMCGRDLKVFLDYLSLEGESEVQYPWATGQWRALKNPRLFEDWARSILMGDKLRLRRLFGFLVRFTDINIAGKHKTEGYPGRLINLLSTGASLTASIFFGAPLVALASEAFPRWANIVIIVIWVLIFLMFLIWWGVDSSHMFLYVLAYTTMLANINVGGD